MLVETFECSETAAEPIEATEEAVALMESLELTGQLELVRPKTVEYPAARMPYRLITAEESFVYRTLCPQQVPLSRYTASPLPLRVLQIAAHVKALEICKRLEVWDKTSSLVEDPVLVGHSHGEYEWSGNKTFILARWGEVLETFSTLRKQAIALHRSNLIQQAASLLKQAECVTEDELMKHTRIDW